MVIMNVFEAANQHIRMISEGSRDTEDAENSALEHVEINYILQYIQQLFCIVIIFHNFYSIYNQIDTAFLSIRDFFQKHKTRLTTPNF